MDSLEQLLGVDPESPDLRRAELLVENDRALLRALVAVRESRGLSQAEVGRRMGISQPSVAALERYDANPKLGTLRRYANAVEALVKHEVVADDGQLARGEGPSWQTVSGPLKPVGVVRRMEGRRCRPTVQASVHGPALATVTPISAA